MNVDTSRTLVIESSPTKLLVLISLGVLMTAGAITVALLPGPLSYRKFLGGYVGTAFFGLCTALWLWRLLTSRGPVITISPEGIRDTRLAASLIPWTAVTGISTWESRRGQKTMVLAVRPDIEPRLALTRLARWTRSANRALGADGLCINASGLKIDYDTLLQTSRVFKDAEHDRDRRGRRFGRDRT